MAIKIGVIGAGGIARRRTIPEGILPSEKVELVAVMSPRSAEEVASQFGVKKAYKNDREIIADPGIEALYIASPVYLHCEQVIASLEAGKHVLCEKPLGMNVSECIQMKESAEKKGLVLAIDFMMRFHSCHQKAKELIKSGTIGQPVLGRAQLTCWYPPMEGAWRQVPGQGGGGALMDMGIHCIDLLRFFFGECSEVFAFTDTITHNYPVDDSATLLLKFQNGAQGIVDSNFNIPDASAQNFLELYGTHGAIFARGTIGQSSTGKLTVISESQTTYSAQQERRPGEPLQIEPEPVNIYKAIIDYFADCIEGRAEPNIEDAIKDQQITMSAYESSKKRVSIRL